MRYGKSVYFETAQQEQAEAFKAEVNRTVLEETKRTAALKAKLAKAGRVFYVGNA